MACDARYLERVSSCSWSVKEGDRFELANLKGWGPRVVNDDMLLWQVTVFYPRRVEVKRCSSRREAEGLIEKLLAVLERGEVERFSVKLQEASPRRAEPRLPGGVGAWVRC